MEIDEEDLLLAGGGRRHFWRPRDSLPLRPTNPEAICPHESFLWLICRDNAGSSVELPWTTAHSEGKKLALSSGFLWVFFLGGGLPHSPGHDLTDIQELLGVAPFCFVFLSWPCPWFSEVSVDDMLHWG